jgi:hypothetical protein
LTFSSCNGEIPISTTIIRSFRVIGDDLTNGLPTILISRTDRLQANGSGSEGQHRVEVSSSGSGSAQLWITPESGRLIHSSGKFSGVVTILASGRRQVFNQTLVEQIETRN